MYKSSVRSARRGAAVLNLLLKLDEDVVSFQLDGIRRRVPYFILDFVLASVVTTVCLAFGVSAEVFAPLKTLSKFFIVMAMAAIGLNTDFKKIVKSGIKPILIGFGCWVSIACVSLLMQKVIGIW